MTLQEIKEGLANEWGYDDWAELCDNEKDYPKDMADHYDRIAKRYAKAKLKEAAERDKIEKIILNWLKSGNENTTYIAELIKKSITETSLD